MSWNLKCVVPQRFIVLFVGFGTRDHIGCMLTQPRRLKLALHARSTVLRNTRPLNMKVVWTTHHQPPSVAIVFAGLLDRLSLLS